MLFRSTVREKLKRSDDARALLRQIYHTEVDLIPDLEAKTLTVCLVYKLGST